MFRLWQGNLQIQFDTIVVDDNFLKDGTKQQLPHVKVHCVEFVGDG